MKASVIASLVLVVVMIAYAIAASVYGDGCACRTTITEDDCRRHGGVIEYRWDTGSYCALPDVSP
jgi:hypothetical protein